MSYYNSPVISHTLFIYGGITYFGFTIKRRKKKMENKTLDVTNVEEAKVKINDIKVVGDGDTFALLCKASSESQGWMKSTKVCNVEDGCILQVTTQQKHPDGSYSVAEALTYVPNANIDLIAEPRKLVSTRRHGILGEYNPTPEDAAERKRSEEEYRYKEYLGILLQLHQAGHDCHAEINETLKKVQSLMF